MRKNIVSDVARPPPQPTLTFLDIFVFIYYIAHNRATRPCHTNLPMLRVCMGPPYGGMGMCVFSSH